MARNDGPPNPGPDGVTETTAQLLARLAANLSRLSPDRLDAFGAYLDGEEEVETADANRDDSANDTDPIPDSLPSESNDRD